jgi:3-hydroxyisobutyrate dehydrogenase
LFPSCLGERQLQSSGIPEFESDTAGLKLPLAKATWKQYEKMKKLGLGELDKSGVAELTFKGRTLHSK